MPRRVSTKKWKNSEKQKYSTRVGSGKLFAVSKTSEIKRIHAARFRLTSIVWKTLSLQGLPRNSRLNVPSMQDCRNIFRRVTYNMVAAVVERMLPLSLRAFMSTVHPPLLGSLLSREEFFDTYLSTYLARKCFTNYRSRDSARYRRDVYPCMYTQHAKRAFTAFGGLYCKQIQ